VVRVVQVLGLDLLGFFDVVLLYIYIYIYICGQTLQFYAPLKGFEPSVGFYFLNIMYIILYIYMLYI
jgi:hypothetical protein